MNKEEHREEHKREEHREEHKRLHNEFDRLLADFLSSETGKFIGKTSLIDFMKWSYTQTIEPSDNSNQEKKE